MAEREKLSIQEFTKMKTQYKKWAQFVEAYSKWTKDTYQNIANFQSKLLSYDLSQIPSSAWGDLPFAAGIYQGVTIPANFEGTHANIDFHTFIGNLENIEFYNFKGCHLEGVDTLKKEYTSKYGKEPNWDAILPKLDVQPEQKMNTSGQTILSVEEFLKKKDAYLAQINNPSLPMEKQEELVKEFQAEILSYDLSQVPASSWEGIYWVVTNDGKVYPSDFSGTHANIDFHYIELIQNYSMEESHWITHCNFNGCHVTGLDELDLYDYYPLSNDEIKKVFGSDIIAKNPHRFPADEIPKDVQNRFYQEMLTFEDIEAYPSLLDVQLVNKPKNRLDEQYTAVYDWNPTLLKTILNQEPKLYQYIATNQIFLPKDVKVESIEQAEQVIAEEIYKELIAGKPRRSSISQKPYKIENFKTKYPDFFLKYHPEMNVTFQDKDLENRFYTRSLTVQDIRNHYEELKNVDYRYLLPGLQQVIEKFGDLEQFFNEIPSIFDEALDIMMNQRENKQTLQEKLFNHSLPLPDFVRRLEGFLICNNPNITALDYYVSTGGSIDELFNQGLSDRISRFYFDTLVKFNEKNDNILREKIEIGPNKYVYIGDKLLSYSRLSIEQYQLQGLFFSKFELQIAGISEQQLKNAFQLANSALLSGNLEYLSMALKTYPMLENMLEQKKPIDFIGKDKLLNYIKDKKILYSIVKKYDVENIRNIVSRLATSNSSEIQRLGENLIEPILATENPYAVLNQIEDIFLKNNLPYVAKTYQVFKILYPEYGSNYGSPMLNAKSSRGKDILIFADLIKASFGSNNRSVINYFESIEKGDKIFRRVLTNQNELSQLSNRDKEVLDTYLGHLNALYNQTMNRRTAGVANAHQLGKDTYENVLEMATLFSKDGKLDYNLPDRLTEMFCHFAGIDTFADAKDYMHAKVAMADKRHREEAKHAFTLKKGDFVKGLNSIQYMESILQNGSVCKEFLGPASTTDGTPLDTDLTRVEEQKETFQKTYDTRIQGYGDISAVLKCDDRFVITKTSRDSIASKENFDATKLEAFYTGGVANSHYGIRTGFASSEIDYFVVPNNNPKLNFEIVKNGFYIPVVNEEGKLVFTPEQYDHMCTKMQGLSYYGLGDTYEFAPIETLITDDIRAVMAQNQGNREETKRKRDAILKTVEKCLAGSGITPVYELEKELVPGTVEIIDTGSTGRGTNKPNDGDFDFIVRLDKALITDAQKLEEFKNLLRQELKVRAKEATETANGDFRYKEVTIDGLEEPVDIDMTFIQKTDKVDYSTDMCLRDRLETIRNLSEEKYQAVLANVIVAKKTLKEGKCYKPFHAKTGENGLGGVGVENWILQNGGSFYEASKTFLAATEQSKKEVETNPDTASMSQEAKNKAEFDRFKDRYQIWDFGKNHTAEGKNIYPHNEFVYDNMAVDGYLRMKETLRAYVKKVDLERQNQSSNVEERADQIIAAMANGTVDVEGNLLQETETNRRTLGYADNISLYLMYTVSALSILLLIACVLFR